MHRTMQRIPSLLDNALDAFVVPGFSKLGYAIRSTRFKPLDTYSLTGKTVVITGPTSGLGEAASFQLAAMNARLILVGRSITKLQATTEALKLKFPHLECELVVADMGNLEAVRVAVADIQTKAPNIHALVHNAGALLNTRAVSQEGLEVTIASHVLGPHLMTTLLLPQLRSANGRVITVSSGGMYAAPLTSFSSGESPVMPEEKYDGSKQYAIAKRMQVTLNEMWDLRETEVSFAAMHPGWADTPGVQESLPTFRMLTKPFLRSPAQGADTISWLVADNEMQSESGKFWCDRAPRSLHKTGNTRTSDTAIDRAALWQWCEEQTNNS